MSRTSGSFLLDQSPMASQTGSLVILRRQDSKQDLCAKRNGPRKCSTISSSTKIMSTQSSKTSKSPSRYSVGMFSAGEARCDRWQDLAHAAQTLVAQSSSGSSTKETLATVEALLAPLGVMETFRAYPGEAMMSALKEALGRSDYSSFSRITNRIAKAIITGSYRRSVNAWKLGEEGEAEGNDRLMKDYFDTGDLTKPYFEVLIVSDDPTPEQVRQGRAELRQLRRPEDPFVYEAVTVPSFEEGVLRRGVECGCAGGCHQGQLPLQIPIRRAAAAHLSGAASVPGVRFAGAEGLRSGSRPRHREDPPGTGCLSHRG